MEEYSGGSLTPVFKHIHNQECKRSTLIPADFRGSQGSQKVKKLAFPLLVKRGRFSVRWAALMFLMSYVLFLHPILTEILCTSHSLSETIRTTLSQNPCLLVLRLISYPFPLQVLLQHCHYLSSMLLSSTTSKTSTILTGCILQMKIPRIFLISLANSRSLTNLALRRSFVEQLENAFQTPAKIGLCYNFGGHLRPDAPPVPMFQ